MTTTKDEIAMERRMSKVETTLEEHVKSCDKRNELILKLVVWAFIGIIGLLVEQTFNLHLPNAPVP